MRKREEETHSLESLARQAQHEETESLSGEERGQKLSLRKCYGLNCVRPLKDMLKSYPPAALIGTLSGRGHTQLMGSAHTWLSAH